MSDQPKSPAPPALRVLDDAAEKSPMGSAVTPSPIPPTVTIGDGDELYREVIDGPAGRGWIAGVALGAAILGASGWWVGSRATLWWVGIPLEIAGAGIALTAWLFHRLTIVVDRAGVAWRFTLVGRRYSWDEVQMFREKFFAHAKDKQSLGWGIGMATDGLDKYEVWGANGPCLDLVVRRGEKTKHFLVSSAVPDRLAAALVRALERRKRERTGDGLS